MTLRPRGGLLNAKKIDASREDVPTCNKDTTGKQRLQKWTRGCFAIVNSAGFIRFYSFMLLTMSFNNLFRYWAPLFKSEGPAQVAVIVLTFLLNILGPMVPYEEWEELGWKFTHLINCLQSLF